MQVSGKEAKFLDFCESVEPGLKLLGLDETLCIAESSKNKTSVSWFSESKPSTGIAFGAFMSAFEEGDKFLYGCGEENVFVISTASPLLSAAGLARIIKWPLELHHFGINCGSGEIKSMLGMYEERMPDLRFVSAHYKNSRRWFAGLQNYAGNKKVMLEVKEADGLQITHFDFVLPDGVKIQQAVDFFKKHCSLSSFSELNDSDFGMPAVVFRSRDTEVYLRTRRNGAWLPEGVTFKTFP